MPTQSFFRPSAFQPARHCHRHLSALSVIRGGSEEIDTSPSPVVEGEEGESKSEEVFHNAVQEEDQQQQQQQQQQQDQQVEEQVFVETIADDPTLEEENSSAYVDRMEYADDEGEDATPGAFEVENSEQQTEQKNEEAAPSTEQQVDSSHGNETPEVAEAQVQTETAPAQGAPNDDDTDDTIATPTPTEGEGVAEEETALQAETHTPPVEAETAIEEPESEVVLAEESTSGSMSTEITAEMKRALIKELSYSRKEVSLMKPDIAAVVLEKRLRRPAEGMPENWYLPGSKKPQTVSVVRQVLPKVIIPVAIGALAVVAGKNLDVGTLLASKSRQTSIVPEYVLPPLPVATAAAEQEDSSTISKEAEEQPPVIHANEHINAVDEPHPHSIKPGQSSTTDELDVTWLDKVITAIEKKIKSLLRLEL